MIERGIAQLTATEEGVDALRNHALDRVGGVSWGCTNEALESMRVAGIKLPPSSTPALDSSLLPQSITGVKGKLDNLMEQLPENVSFHNTSEQSVEELTKVMQGTEAIVGAFALEVAGAVAVIGAKALSQEPETEKQSEKSKE